MSTPPPGPVVHNNVLAGATVEQDSQSISSQDEGVGRASTIKHPIESLGRVVRGPGISVGSGHM